MLLSFAIIFLCGLLLGSLFKAMRFPPLFGMLLAGIILGPHALGLLDGSVLEISPQLRKIALIIILTRAGLNLDTDSLKKVGRPAALMCFLPACCEIVATVIIAPLLFDISLIEAALLGSVLAAVSPAVVVPRMLRLIETKRGTKQGIPQLIMAGASVDDIFVIVLFSSFTQLASGGDFSAAGYLRIPTSILLGLPSGLIIGIILTKLFEKFKPSDNLKVIITISVSFLLVTLEDAADGIIGFSGLLAIMGMGAAMARKAPDMAKKVSAKYSSLWAAAEILLFVLVGAAVDIGYAADFGIKAVILLFSVLIFRMLGVALCVVKTSLSAKERLFCMLAYTPKATVQAAIGSIPLAMGLSCGNLVLTAAVLAILITAPLGAFAMDMTCEKLLEQD